MNAILFLATVMFAIQAAPLVHAPEPPTGALVGRVPYVGPAIPDQVIEVIRDSAFCGTQATIKSVAVHVKTHGLEGAVVSIDGVAPAHIRAFASTARIDEYPLYFHPAHCRRHGWATGRNPQRRPGHA